MALAERASPPPPSDELPSGAAGGYLVRLQDPPYGAAPLEYAGDYGRFSRPSRGDPLRGEAVAYLSSWAARLAEASGPVGWPQLVWEGEDGLEWAKGAFRAPSYSGSRLDLFRMRELGFMRLGRAAVGPSPSDSPPPAPASWLASWSSDDDGGYDGYSPPEPPEPVVPVPAFVSGFFVAGSQSAADANGGKWLVPSSAPDAPFDSAVPDLVHNRFALKYMASVSGRQSGAALADGGFASRYAVPPPVRLPGSDAPVPDPGFVQEPEPLRASAVRALFEEDVLASGRSRTWSAAPVFAALGAVKTVPAVAETRWVYYGSVDYAWTGAVGGWPAVSTGEMAFEPYDFGPEDPSTTESMVAFRAGPDASGGYVLLQYRRQNAEWTALYYVDGQSVRPAMTVRYQSPNLDTLVSGTALPSAGQSAGSCRFSITDRVPYDYEVEPARSYREWGTVPVSAPSFSFRSAAELEPADQAAWAADHPEPTSAQKEAWFESAFGVDLSAVDDLWVAIGGVEGLASWGTAGELGVSEAWASAVGSEPCPPYSGTVRWADAVGLVRDLDWPDELWRTVSSGLGDGWSLGSAERWVVSGGGNWDDRYYGINWARRGEGDEREWAPSGAPANGDGRFDLEYVASAPASGPGPLGSSVPVRSADSVAVRPLFCATVSVSTTAVKSVASTSRPTDLAGTEYERVSRFGKVVHEASTRYVVGFVPVPCLWRRDAGEASAAASERHPLGGSGPDALWAFVASAVLGPALGISSARDLLSGAGAAMERYVPAAAGTPSPAVPVPHSSVAAKWTLKGTYGGGTGQAFLPEVSFARDGDSVESAVVEGTVEFPLCVYESGYCA